MPNAVRLHAELRAALLAMIALAMPLAAARVHAEDVKFVEGATHWLGPFGDGVALQVNQIWVDANGTGGQNAGDTYHPVPPGIDTSWDLKLSPTRRIMIATSFACVGTSTNIRVFAIPRSDHAMTELGSQQTLNGCLNPVLFFDPDTTAPFRTALFREVGDVLSDPHYLWWNLVTGERGISPFAYEFPTGYVEFSPTGTMAFVQHDVNGPNGTNYSIVSLCPATIGQSSQPGVEVDDAVSAWYVPGTPPSVDYRNSVGASVGGADYDDCSASAPLGACCKPDGSCAQITQAGCTGTWTEGAPCSPCPSASLSIQLTGPVSAERGGQAIYTLTASNLGTLPSVGVVVTDRIPTGTTFVSASAGGTFEASTSTVTWSLGTLGAVEQEVLTLTVQAPCFGTSMVNDTYSISGAPGGTVTGTPVTTPLTFPVPTGLTLTLLSQAIDPIPLQTGGRVRYTVRMANASAVPRDQIFFIVNAGAVSTMSQLVNDGGGTVTFSPMYLQWIGDLPAGATVDVVYETAISECRSTQGGIERMNNGPHVSVRNVCNVSLMTAAAPPAIAVAPSAYSARLESPSHGPVQSWGSSSGNRVVACRSGDAVDVTLWLFNASGASSPGANVALTLPAELPGESDPPFVGTPPAGTTWDSETQTISWSGQIPANDSLGITVRVVGGATGCYGSLFSHGGIGTCSSQFTSNLSVFPVHVPPETHLLTLVTNEGLAYMDPAQPGTWKPLLCGAFESLRGLGRTPDGTIWVAGVPSFRLRPEPLEFEIFPDSFYSTLGMDTPFDMAGDPTDSTVVIAGYRSGYGLRLRRYDPDTRQVTSILDNNSVATVGLGRHVTVSDDRIIGVNTNNFVLRVDPANPTAFQSFAPASGGVTGLTLDEDGNWLTSGSPNSSSETRALFSVHRDTGAYTAITDLTPYFSWYVDLPAIATDPLLGVYLASTEAIIAKVARASGNTVQTSVVPLNHVDYLWVGGPPPTTAVDPPATFDGPVSLALAPPHPNPSRGGVELGFSLPAAGHASLAVYDIVGRRVRTLAEGDHAAGRHDLTWDGHADSGARLGAGLYFVKLVTPAGERVARLAVTR